jgi:uncharacterized repeat protein (TIGR03803 family)
MRSARHALRFFLLVLVCVSAAIPSIAQSFSSVAFFNLSDGYEPEQPLIVGSDGNFYGTASFGGDLSCNSGYGCGLIFKMDGSGNVTVLHSFSGADGEAPYALVQAADGNFYGTTPCRLDGGAPSQPTRPPRSRTLSTPGGVFYCNGPGSFFQLSPSGVLTTLHVFVNPANGLSPSGSLVQGRDGNFYGVTYAGGTGTNGAGTIFQVSSTGTLTPLYNFCSQPNCTDGSYPFGALVQAPDGSFYGTTDAGGDAACEAPYGCGTVFKITPGGTLTTLHRFSGADGQSPNGGLVLTAEGTIYGATSLGGPNQNCPDTTCGTLFKITSTGTFTTLYNFDGGIDGARPSPLMQATDGNLYGTTYWGGAIQSGAIFRITPSGTLSTLYSLCSNIPGVGCADGLAPSAGLVQGPDGLLYGTTSLGGFKSGTAGCYGYGCGSVFSVSPNSKASQFVPITPCRIMDTRLFNSPIQGGTVQEFDIIQDAGLWGCGDLSSATAFSLNVTVVPHEPLGYLTVWPASANQPVVSTLNSPDGSPRANALIVARSSIQFNPGVVNFYASDTTDVIIDVNGYFTAPGAQTLQFYPLTPCRVVDTRNGQDGGTLQAGVERDYTMAGQCGIPASAQAYSMNVTALPAPGGLDYLTVWAQGEARPMTSTLNASAGEAVANAAIVAAGSNQAVAFYANSNNTDLLVDVNGYFAPAGAGGNSFYTVPNCRIYDSRDDNGQPFSGQRTIDIAAQACAPPSNAQAYVFSATVVPDGPLSYLTLWEDPQQQPAVSTLNAIEGAITSNLAIVSNGNGNSDAFAAGYTQLILDISGYFAQ